MRETTVRWEVFSHFLTHRSSNTIHQSGSLFLRGSGSLVHSTQVTGCRTFTAILELAKTHTHTHMFRHTFIAGSVYSDLYRQSPVAPVWQECSHWCDFTPQWLWHREEEIARKRGEGSNRQNTLLLDIKGKNQKNIDFIMGPFQESIWGYWVAWHRLFSCVPQSSPSVVWHQEEKGVYFLLTRFWSAKQLVSECFIINWVIKEDPVFSLGGMWHFNKGRENLM